MNRLSSKQEYLFAKLLKTYKTDAPTFDLIEWVIIKKVNWSICLGVCLDSVKSMTGTFSGLVARIRKRILNGHTAVFKDEQWHIKVFL